MPDYIEDFKKNPACSLVTVQVDPWNWKDQILLLGDAAHAVVPFYGQGMNAAFEDVFEFNKALTAHGNQLAAAVPAFAKKRRPAGVGIMDLSMNNYIEMRHHSGSALFRFRKKVEGVLNWIFPSAWIPLYKMVAFTSIP